MQSLSSAVSSGVPGAAQHEVVRCRTGILVWVA
jgi:hypothetical protein